MFTVFHNAVYAKNNDSNLVEEMQDDMDDIDDLDDQDDENHEDENNN